MALRLVCAAAGRPGWAAPRFSAASRGSLAINGGVILGAWACATSRAPAACAAIPPRSPGVTGAEEPGGADSGNPYLDAVRKRLLESLPTVAADLKWRKVVQELRDSEERWLERYLGHEKKGEALEQAEAYKSWKKTREELDMYEQDPRRWLRQHGRFCGLEEQMTRADYLLYYGEVAWPVIVYTAGILGWLGFEYYRFY